MNLGGVQVSIVSVCVLLGISMEEREAVTHNFYGWGKTTVPIDEVGMSPFVNFASFNLESDIEGSAYGST